MWSYFSFSFSPSKRLFISKSLIPKLRKSILEMLVAKAFSAASCSKRFLVVISEILAELKRKMRRYWLIFFLVSSYVIAYDENCPNSKTFLLIQTSFLPFSKKVSPFFSISTSKTPSPISWEAFILKFHPPSASCVNLNFASFNLNKPPVRNKNDLEYSLQYTVYQRTSGSVV